MSRNDGVKLRAIAMGQALSHGQAVLKANKRMEWIMSMGETPPKILWARIAQVHEETEVAQVAVRFDSNQVCQVLLLHRVAALQEELLIADIEDGDSGKEDDT
jgi:hypothetical protein